MGLGNCLCVARELVAHPDIFRDQVVLELGSGTGLVGLVAALAGAQQVGAVCECHVRVVESCLQDINK